MTEESRQTALFRLRDTLSKSGTFWIIVTIITSSLEPVLAKIGYRGYATPFQLLFIKAVVGALAILPLTGRKHWIGLRNARKFIPVTILFTVTNALVLISLKYIGAVMVITVITITPAVVAIINWGKGREYPGLKFWAGFGLSLLGIALTIRLFQAGSLQFQALGIGCIVLSVFTSAIYRTNIDDLTAEYAPGTCSIYIFIMNAFLSSLLCLPLMGPIHASVWKFGIVIGIAAAIANVAFLSAIHLIGSTKSSVLSLIQRPVVIVAVALVLRESLAMVQIIGILLTLVGTQMASVKKRVQDGVS